MGQLPIQEVLPAIATALSGNNTLILQAPPGAGKSTVVPLELLDTSWLSGQKIIILEPRKLAARAVAARMAQTLDENLGETVGYRVRFDSKIGKNTRIEVVTEGILTRMLQSDNSLEGYGLVIFDEFHERSLHADLSLALCREIQQVLREDLRILIMSATLDTANLSELLGNPPVVSSEGRQYPLTIHYSAPENGVQMPKYMASAIRKAFLENKGDILAFFPGSGEIVRTSDLLEQAELPAVICPLYGDLNQEKQQQAINPDTLGRRKIVLATSIAETSLTISGITVVVDSGFSRNPRFDPRSGLSKLETVRITRDSADQRAGRAARLGPGVCYRMWSSGTHQQLVPNRKPEILEADLAPLVLELAQWGMPNIQKMAWLNQPPAGAVAQAIDLLTDLEAMEGKQITARGRQMLALPTHPRIAHLILESKEMGLESLACDLAALLEERDPMSDQFNLGTDIWYRLEALQQYRNRGYVQADRIILERVDRLAQVWRRNTKVSQYPNLYNHEQIGSLLAAAYPERIARRQGTEYGLYKLANGRTVRLPESDSLISEEWLAIAAMDAGKTDGKVFMAAALNPEQVKHLFTSHEVTTWDYQKGVLIARMERRLGEILVDSKPSIPEPEAVQTVLAQVVSKEGLNLFNWTTEVLNFRARLSSIAVWEPELDLPNYSDENLLQNPSQWLGPWLANIKRQDDFNKLDMAQILSSGLTWEQQQLLDKLAPAKLKVPSGFDIPLQYQADGSKPVLAVRLQELFGLAETPSVANGKVQVLIHLLSPGYKPVQVTQDLKSFWTNTYPEVRKELKPRYPKHSWPDDPWTAEAIRGVKKRTA